VSILVPAATPYPRPVRYVIVGNGGAGKSTLARRLSEITRLPVVHLDRLFWQPGWIETPKDAWRALQADVFAGEAWIADGNYGGSMEIRLARADCVVLLDYSRIVCVMGVLRRVVRYRDGSRPDLAEGCPERFDLAFVRYVWNYNRDSRPRVLAKIREHAGDAVVVRLRSRRSARAWLDEQARGVEGRTPKSGR
jgi:adenylate kinase family enzyme